MSRLVLWMLVLAGCGRLGFDDELPGPPPPGGCALTLAPAEMRLNFNSARAFTADGGLEPYRYTLTGTGAAIDPASALVTADDQPANGMVTVTDDAGCTADAALTIGGDTLWYVGGSSNGVPQQQVWKSTDGVAWTLAGSLPDKRTSGALYVFHDRLWWATGSDGVGNRDEVWSTADGASWTLAGHVPLASVNPGFTVFEDRMWLIGGAANPDTDEVYASSDGATWALVGHLPQLNHGGSAVVAAGKVWYLGGHNNSNGMLYRWALSSATGATFQQPGNMATGREYGSAVVVDETIVFAGGQDTTPTALSTVLATTDGVTFAARSPLPVARAFTALVRFGDVLLSIGGNDGGGVFTSSAFGGAWAPVTSSFPVPRQAGRIAVFSPN